MDSKPDIVDDRNTGHLECPVIEYKALNNMQYILGLSLSSYVPCPRPSPEDRTSQESRDDGLGGGQDTY